MNTLRKIQLKSLSVPRTLWEKCTGWVYVKQDEKKACELYRSIVEDDDSFSEYDDYYWRACFRLGEATHYGLGTEKNPDKAAELISKAKRIYEKQYNGEIVDQKKYADPQAVHPFALVWREDTYYLIALYNLNRGQSCYRLNRMENVRIIENAPSIILKDAFGSAGPQILRDFIRQSVYSFHGDARLVKLRAQEKMVDTIIDHFGKGISLSNNGDGTVIAMVKVSDNRGLYYFLLKYGETIQVLEPEDIRVTMKAKLTKILEEYRA